VRDDPRRFLGQERILAVLDVTYNFDPDRWYENQRLRLDLRHRSGELTDEDAAKAIEELDRRYEAMVLRLDGTFGVQKTDGK
jgi:hypothetical protein